MQPPDQGHAALYIKCPACGVWEMHVAGTEQFIADVLSKPELLGWGCTACGHWWSVGVGWTGMPPESFVTGSTHVVASSPCGSRGDRKMENPQAGDTEVFPGLP